MNSRKVILNHYRSLQQLPVAMITLCIMGKHFQNDLTQFLRGSEDIWVYHQKGDRIFQKHYPRDSITGSLLELIWEQSVSLKLKKDDFTFPMNDPYYQKPVSDLAFQELMAVPVHKDGVLIGCGLIYYKEACPASEAVSEGFFGEVIEEVLEEEEKETLLSFHSTLLDHQLPAYIVQEKATRKIYLSEEARKICHGDEVTEDVLNKPVWHLLDGHYALSKEETEEYVITMLSQIHDYQRGQVHIMSDLNRLEDQAKRSLLAVINKDREQAFDAFCLQATDATSKVIEEKPELFQYDGHALLFVYDAFIDKRLVNQLSALFPQYRFGLIRVTKEIPPKLDLVKVSTYLIENSDGPFSYNDYLAYRKKADEEAYYEELIRNHQGSLVLTPVKSSKTAEVFGYMADVRFNNLVVGQTSLSRFDLSLAYSRQLFSLLQRQKEWPGLVFITLTGKQLLSEEMTEGIQKLNEKAPDRIGLYLTDLHAIEKKILVKVLVRLKRKGYFLLADENIFASFNLFELMEHISGLVIAKDTFNLIQKGEENLLSMVINHYLERQKIIIFKDLTAAEMLVLKPHPNVFIELAAYSIANDNVA